MTTEISGYYTDIFEKRIFPASILIAEGRIKRIKETNAAPRQYILPGFVDAHVHVESSMLTPSGFARMAVRHGTVAAVSDPHEIANVCGMEGIEFMLHDSSLTPFKFFFGAPSCVPATSFETAGAVLDARAVSGLLSRPDIWYLSEMMNYPGVLAAEPEIIEKIAAARLAGKPVDGHAPGLRGSEAARYAAAGITTDHECFNLEEALDKIAAGMSILIREGSAAKNFEALAPLLKLHPGKVMFCSDDKHPDDLAVHHINRLVTRALAKGFDLFDVLRAACLNPVIHYKLPVGLLREGDPADFIVVGSLSGMEVRQTVIGGAAVMENGTVKLRSSGTAMINNFRAVPKSPEDFRLPGSSSAIRVIEALEGQLITRSSELPARLENGFLIPDPDNDILKITVVNRYIADAVPAVAFIRNFGLKNGALASTVAHDCHNIIAVGTDDHSICAAVNELIRIKGGITVCSGAGSCTSLELPIGGLMTHEDGFSVAASYNRLEEEARALGCSLGAPFMTLSFMALLVIPELKLSDKGLFDGNTFRFTQVEANG